jgi:Cupredoxin-like domain
VIPVLSAFRAHRHKTLVGIFPTLALILAGCMGGGPEATLTVGAEGFEPPVVTVEAGTSFDLEVVNDTKAVQTVTVEGRPGLRVLPGETSQRQIDSLGAGEYKVTLEGTPFEATVRAEE